MMNKFTVGQNAIITTVPLEQSIIDEEVILGSSMIPGSFIKTSELGVEAVNLLNAGNTKGETEKLLFERYHQEIFIKELIQTLFNANLIRSINNIRINDGTKKKIINDSAENKILFSKVSYFIYTIIIFLAFLFNFNFIKNYSSLVSLASQFSEQYPLWAFSVIWILVMKHEIFHYWAALSLGVPAQIKIGSRFIFIVLETQSDAMNLLERKKRYRFYLSGTVGDLVFLAFVLISKTIINLAGISTFNSIISLVTLQTIVGIIFQLDIFLKTDYYFVFADWFKLDNLYTHSGYILKSWLWRTIPKTKLEKYNQTLIFAIGRLINYIVISLVALMGVFVLLGHFQSINNLNINIGVNILDKLYCLVYILMWGFIFIVRKRKKKKYFIQFE